MQEFKKIPKVLPVQNSIKPKIAEPKVVKTFKIKKHHILWFIGFAVLFIFLYLFISNIKLKNEIQQTKQNQTQKQTENQMLLKQVSELIVLPQGEEPVIATVTDLEKLKGQEFFKKALQGDKVLIYQVSKKAILFRPAVNKIIEVAPIGANLSLP